MSKRTFDQREWVNDIVSGVITGVAGGMVGAMLVPHPPFLDLMLSGGLVGLVTGTLVLPIKWLLNCRPRDAGEGESYGKDQDHDT